MIVTRGWSIFLRHSVHCGKIWFARFHVTFTGNWCTTNAVKDWRQKVTDLVRVKSSLSSSITTTTCLLILCFILFKSCPDALKSARHFILNWHLYSQLVHLHTAMASVQSAGSPTHNNGIRTVSRFTYTQQWQLYSQLVHLHTAMSSVQSAGSPTHNNGHCTVSWFTQSRQLEESGQLAY